MIIAAREKAAADEGGNFSIDAAAKVLFQLFELTGYVSKSGPAGERVMSREGC